MKTTNTFFAALASACLMLSCSSDDSSPATGTGAINIEFDNVYGANNLILGTQPNTTSQGETLKINQLKYIVSNIKLTRTDGTIFTYPKSQSYFIVDETDLASQTLNLQNIPAGDYASITFGIGVDEEQWLLGADGQGDFLSLADSEDMMWSWSAGYKFVMFEGNFTSGSVANETPFMVHTGKTGTDYNYTSVTIPFTNSALVRTDITPQVHIFADASKIIDGNNKIILSDNNEGGMGAMIMGGENLPLITANLSQMFTVNHVHND
ncbi:MAG: hypothetical protein EOO50_04920 [Flavobacterium sp.]|uniref:MbnP family protein n=1 Tax=Flavobacterium sp. TaxID=239 RepID=UPI001213C0D2|nr:MbnP family protein [Flavobacterium sp.]RZJ67625.1 MAG: hypothetical protein EOO50_04920 [Flavobacterium sp.]